jgi:hypothetical protein
VTNFDCAKLAVKLIGLWAMISSSRSVTNVVEAVYINRSSGMPMPFGLAVAALTPLAMGLIGLYLWVRSDRLASSIFPVVSAVESSGAEDLERLLPLALSLMGVWLVSVAIPTLVYNISFSIFRLAPSHQSVFGPIYESPAMTATSKANIIAALVRAFIGLGLILGSKRLAEIISAMRGRQSFSE